MFEEKEDGAEEKEASEREGVYNLSAIEFDNLKRISEAKTRYLLSLSTFLSDLKGIRTANNQLLDILITMDNIIYKYFKKEIDEGKVFKVRDIKDGKEYSLKDYIKAVEDLSNNSKLLTADIINLLRNIAKNSFSIYDYYEQRLKVAVPTQEHNAKKKLIDLLFSTRPNFDASLFLAEYRNFISHNHFHSNNFNFLAYSVSKMRDFNLKSHILNVGAAQIGKSTLTLCLSKRIYEFRGIRLLPSFLRTNLVWNATQGFTAFENIKNDIIASDEAYFLADRREAMNYLNIKYLQLLNALASNHNIHITTIQDYTDLDSRIIKNVDILLLHYEQGSCQVFAQSHSFPIIHRTILDTKRFEKKPSLLATKKTGLYELAKQMSYIFDIHYWQFGLLFDEKEIWQEYSRIKPIEQNKAIGRVRQGITSYTANKPQKTDNILKNLIQPDDYYLDSLMRANSNE